MVGPKDTFASQMGVKEGDAVIVKSFKDIYGQDNKFSRQDAEVYLAPRGAREDVKDINGKRIPTPKSIVASHEVFGACRDLMITGR